MMTVSAVVVTYNRLKMLKEVIAALQTSETPVDHIIVVDNNSNPDTNEYLVGLGKAIDYVRLSENIGGAGGFNRGVRYFIEQTTDDFVWLMDDDTVPNSNTLTQLLSFAEKTPDFGFLASDIRWTDGHRTKMNDPAPKSGLGKISESETEPQELLNATFVSLLMRRQIVAQIGLPITDFFIWGDDIEYTERAARVAPGYFIPAAKVTHKMVTNVGSNIASDDLSRVPRYYYSYRNKVYYGKKRDFVGHIKSNLRITLDFIKLLVARNVDGKSTRIRTLLNGVKDGLHFKPNIEFAHDNH
jgi:GT2 family glycosyltransferase